MLGSNTATKQAAETAVGNRQNNGPAGGRSAGGTMVKSMEMARAGCVQA